MSRSDRILLHGLEFTRTKHVTINGDTEIVVTNLFVVTGLVRIHNLRGIVETATLDAVITDCWWDLFPTAGASVPITKEAGAPAMSNFEVGSFIIKDDIVTNIATVKRANVGMLLEETAAFQNPFKPFLIGKKSTAVTQIRFMYTAGGDYSSSTGVIHFEVNFEPISVGSKITPA